MYELAWPFVCARIFANQDHQNDIRAPLHITHANCQRHHFLNKTGYISVFFPVVCMMYPIAKICLQSKNQNSVMSNKFLSAYYYNLPTACSYLMYPIAKICLQSKNLNSAMSNKFVSAYYYYLPIACSYLKKIGTPHGCMSHVSTAALFKWGTWKQWYIWYVMRQL